MKKKITYCLLCVLLFNTCTIHNDIPYPTVEGVISAFEVEGQCDSSGNSSTSTSISKTNYTVSLYVDDTVDLTKVPITKLTVSNDAEIEVDSAACVDYGNFPTAGFSSLSNLSSSADTRVNFSKPVTFTLHTYQDYVWTVTVEQIINREVVVSGQIGNAVIDDTNRNVVIYVSKSQSLSAIQVTKFTLGGQNGTVVPDPTAYDTYDFSEPCTFYVSQGWEETSHEWTVYVYHSDSDDVEIESDIFVRATNATVTGSIQSGKEPTIEYKKSSASSWATLDDSAVDVSGLSYEATISGLTPGTSYQYRVTIDDTTSDAVSFTTAAATELTDGSFDNWHQDGKVWNPWSEGGDSFWDTGNDGATTVGNSNSVPSEDTCNGSGYAAELESKWIVLKFAAGNIFTGSYDETDGTNGILSFGRPFTSFPSKLRVNYKYTPATIDRVGDDDLDYLKGVPDSCHIYIALTDWDEPYQIRTRPSTRQLFDKTDSSVIAYAELIKGDEVSTYREVDLELDYRHTDRTPTYILVVATASKYGDYFTGGTGSVLYVDNFELIYE